MMAGFNKVLLIFGFGLVLILLDMFFYFKYTMASTSNSLLLKKKSIKKSMEVSKTHCLLALPPLT